MILWVTKQMLTKHRHASKNITTEDQGFPIPSKGSKLVLIIQVSKIVLIHPKFLYVVQGEMTLFVGPKELVGSNLTETD